MALYQLGEDAPQLGPDVWVADNASVIGRVRLGAKANVWYGAVIRGDNEWITVGEGSNGQECSVLHTDPGLPLVVGDGVTIGHQVMLHGCTIGDGALIGIQAIVLNGARIGSHCLVGAGSLVTEGKEFPDGALIMGTPAKVVRMLDADQIAMLKASAAGYIDKARRHRGIQRID